MGGLAAMGVRVEILELAPWRRPIARVHSCQQEPRSCQSSPPQGSPQRSPRGSSTMSVRQWKTCTMQGCCTLDSTAWRAEGERWRQGRRQGQGPKGSGRARLAGRGTSRGTAGLTGHAGREAAGSYQLAGPPTPRGPAAAPHHLHGVGHRLALVGAAVEDLQRGRRRLRSARGKGRGSDQTHTVQSASVPTA